MSVPFSPLASEEAKQQFVEQSRVLQGFEKILIDSDVKEAPRQTETDWAQQSAAIEKWRARFSVSVKQESFGGVQANVLQPVAGVLPKNKRRVLINLHGGGFLFGAGRNGEILSGQAESIPIAGLGGIKVITVDYRQGPEHRFPAASVDVATVYRELLRSYPPGNVGIYGCSAGGMLTAEAVAWFQTHALPRPGAVGIFGAGALVPEVGDSQYVGTQLMGMSVLSPERGKALFPYFDVPSLKAYFDAPGSLNIKDPLVSPVYSPMVLAAFPPSLLISGTRDMGLSPAAYTHSQMVKHGVRADLHVWEGATHCSFVSTTDPAAPESREAWDVIVKFFDSNLGR